MQGTEKVITSSEDALSFSNDVLLHRDFNIGEDNKLSKTNHELCTCFANLN